MIASSSGKRPVRRLTVVCCGAFHGRWGGQTFSWRLDSGEEIRCSLDDYSECKVNSAFGYADKIDLRALDELIWLLRAWIRWMLRSSTCELTLSSGERLCGPVHASWKMVDAEPLLTTLDLHADYISNWQLPRLRGLILSLCWWIHNRDSWAVSLGMLFRLVRLPRLFTSAGYLDSFGGDLALSFFFLGAITMMTTRCLPLRVWRPLRWLPWLASSSCWGLITPLTSFRTSVPFRLCLVSKLTALIGKLEALLSRTKSRDPER